MPDKRKRRGFWRTCRICFRYTRISIWIGILLLLGCLIYVNQIGLPGFLKRPLLEKLRERGLDLQFSRLRLRWDQGIVAENVRFGSADEPLSPEFKVAQVQVELNHKALSKFQFQVDSLRLRRGRLAWPIAETNQPSRQLAVENIQTELRLLPGDEWALDHFKAVIAGAQIQLSGTVTNASAVRDWKLFEGRGKKPTPGSVWQKRIRELADTLEAIHFSSPPELRVDLRGDAKDLQSFHLWLTLNTPGAETPWGSVHDGKFNARVFPTGSNEISHAELSLEAADAQTRWTSVTNVDLLLHLVAREGATNIVNAHLELSAGVVQSQWGGASNAQFTAQWIHAFTNPIPLSGTGELICENAQSPWGSVGNVRLAGRLLMPPETTALRADESWAWWAALEPYMLQWDGELSEVKAAELEAAKIVCGGNWYAPTLAITNLQAELYGGKLDARGKVNVASRALKASVVSDFDPHKAEHVLTEGGRRWLQQYSWTRPPMLAGDMSLVLPAWTNRHPNWRTEVQPTLALDGDFNLTQGGAFRGITFIAARSHFSYTNMVWCLSDLLATRPEGRIQGFHLSDDITKDYYWRISSTLNPGIVRPLLEPKQQRGLDFFTFTQSPHIDGEVWGRWHDPDSISFKARIASTNFTFRGEWVDDLQCFVQLTNRFLLLTDGRLRHGTQHLSAEALGADFEAKKLYLTNGFGVADAQLVTRAIGPHIERIIEPYEFSRPPTARVYGVIPLEHEEDADLHFDISGGPFHWWKFNVQQISGQVHWVGHQLTLSNIRSDLYGGKATGNAVFDFRSTRGADYRFAISTTNTLLQFLVPDVFGRTNHLEGFLSGNLVITNANSENPNSMRGYGFAEFRDGLIWAIPLFGALSPALDSLMPGLGSSRASAGTAAFLITNGIIHSDNLEIRSPAVRMQYRGNIDLDGRLNARVEAELLRDMWLVGPVVSTVFWPVTKLFEYKVTGSLGQPKLDPVYFVPKIVQMPFHPFRTLKDMMPEDTSRSGTNSPPVFEKLPTE
jgi:hypothetical protein